MKSPTRVELDYFLMHVYDAGKAHAYYERNKKLKGRNKPGKTVIGIPNSAKALPLVSKASPKEQAAAKAQIKKDQAAKAKLRKELTVQIADLEGKLKLLKEIIAEKVREADSQKKQSEASQRTTAREAAKPPTAAERAEAARESAKYRNQNQQAIKTASNTRASKQSGSTTSKVTANQAASKIADEVTELKTLATTVQGRIVVAKNKLAAL